MKPFEVRNFIEIDFVIGYISGSYLNKSATGNPLGTITQSIGYQLAKYLVIWLYCYVATPVIISLFKLSTGCTGLFRDYPLYSISRGFIYER